MHLCYLVRLRRQVCLRQPLLPTWLPGPWRGPRLGTPRPGRHTQLCFGAGRPGRVGGQPRYDQAHREGGCRISRRRRQGAETVSVAARPRTRLQLDWGRDYFCCLCSCQFDGSGRRSAGGQLIGGDVIFSRSCVSLFRALKVLPNQ